MATKNTKPTKPPVESPAPTPPASESAIAPSSHAKPVPVQRETSPTANPNVSPAKAMQAQSIAPPEPVRISVTLRTDTSYEYNLDLPRGVVDSLLNPDVPDCFVEVPARAYGGQPLHGTRRFLHTAYIKEIDVRGME